MGTIILHNIVSLIMIFAFIFVLKSVRKSNFSKNKQLIIKVIGAILICNSSWDYRTGPELTNYTADVAKIK